MQLTPDQLAQYERDGFLIFPGLLEPDEVAALGADTVRLAGIQSPYIRRERQGAPRSIMRVHEDNGDTASPEFRALSRLPRLLKPAMQLLNDEQLYIYHTKINVKPAFIGTIWSWHQDYGTWKIDGVPTDNMTTALVMLDKPEEIAGALYFVPGSHRLGDLEHVSDPEVGALNVYSVRRDLLAHAMSQGKAVPVLGPPGTVAFFHCNLIHGSGHNMSAHDRKQMYVVYNTVANQPHDVPDPRPDHARSTNFAPLSLMGDDAIRRAAEARAAQAAQKPQAEAATA